MHVSARNAAHCRPNPTGWGGWGGGRVEGFVDPFIPLSFVIASLFQWLAQHSIKQITAGNGEIQEIIISHTSVLSVCSQLRDGFLLDSKFP